MAPVDIHTFLQIEVVEMVPLEAAATALHTQEEEEAIQEEVRPTKEVGEDQTIIPLLGHHSSTATPAGEAEVVEEETQGEAEDQTPRTTILGLQLRTATCPLQLKLN